MIIKDFTKPEIDYFLANCNFTTQEEQFFMERTRGNTLEEIAEKMNVSIGTCNNYSKKVKKKILKIV